MSKIGNYAKKKWVAPGLKIGKAVFYGDEPCGGWGYNVRYDGVYGRSYPRRPHAGAAW
jgi:hypothetical protein